MKIMKQMGEGGANSSSVVEAQAVVSPRMIKGSIYKNYLAELNKGEESK